MALRRVAMARSMFYMLAGGSDVTLVAVGGQHFARVGARGLPKAPGSRWHRVAVFPEALRSVDDGMKVGGRLADGRCGLCMGLLGIFLKEHPLWLDGDPYGFAP